MVSDAADIATLLGDPARLDILLTLIDHRREDPAVRGRSFSALFEGTDIPDKGNFNYHLDRLTGRLVTKVDGTYTLTKQGEAVIGGVLAGRFTDEGVETPVEEPCPTCGSSLVLDVDPGRLEVRCPADHLRFQTCLAPGVLEDRTPEAVLDLAVVQWQEVLELAQAGACINCYGDERGEISLHDHDGEQIPLYRSFCSQCGHQFRVPPGALVIRHPAVVAAHHHAGIDVRDRAPWELEFCSTRATTVQSTDPLRVAITVSPGAATVDLVLDRRGSVRDVSEEVLARPG